MTKEIQIKQRSSHSDRHSTVTNFKPAKRTSRPSIDDDDQQSSVERISSTNYFTCKNCGIRFLDRNTCETHQEEYCREKKIRRMSRSGLSFSSHQ